MSEKTKKLNEIINEALQGTEYDLYMLDWSKKGRRWRLTVYIDKEGTISTKDCSFASKRISSHLDKIDLIKRPYDLDISSPGLERPLVNPHHFVSAIEETIKVKTYRPVNGRKNFEGILTSFEGKNTDPSITLKLSNNNTTVSLPLEHICNATTKPQLKI